MKEVSEPPLPQPKGGVFPAPGPQQRGKGGRGRAVPQPGSASSLLGTAFKGSRVGGKQESSPQGKKGESFQAN